MKRASLWLLVAVLTVGLGEPVWAQAQPAFSLEVLNPVTPGTNVAVVLQGDPVEVQFAVSPLVDSSPFDLIRLCRLDSGVVVSEASRGDLTGTALLDTTPSDALGDLEVVYVLQATGAIAVQAPQMVRVVEGGSAVPTPVGADVAIPFHEGATEIVLTEVLSPGITSLVKGTTPPLPAPEGYEFLGAFYDISTTASYLGYCTIWLSYEDGEVPEGVDPSRLCLLAYDASLGRWVDITATPSGPPDKRNWVCGRTLNNSWFAIALAPAGVATGVGSGVTIPLNAGGTRIVFSDVLSAGITTGVRTTIPPLPAPEGFQFLEGFYDLSTTAGYRGDCTIWLSYEEGQVPVGTDPDRLRMLASHDPAPAWADVTVQGAAPPDNRSWRCGRSLQSWFALAIAPEGYLARHLSFLPPINADGSSIFKLGRTVPVKVRLVDDSGAVVPEAALRIYAIKLTDQILGEYVEPTATNAPDAGNAFRWDPATQQYIFNLGTRYLSAGTWRLTTVGDLVRADVEISLR